MLFHKRVYKKSDGDSYCSYSYLFDSSSDVRKYYFITSYCINIIVSFRRITFDSNEDLEIKKAAFLSSFGYHPFIHTQEREPLMDEADFKALINAVMASRNRTSFKYKRIRPWAKYRIDNGDKGKRCGQEEVLVMVDSRTSLKGAEMRRALRKVFKENEVISISTMRLSFRTVPTCIL